MRSRRVQDAFQHRAGENHQQESSDTGARPYHYRFTLVLYDVTGSAYFIPPAQASEEKLITRVDGFVTRRVNVAKLALCVCHGCRQGH
jgi:hypothetical protein